MGFNYRDYVNRYTTNIKNGGEPLNEAETPYGVRVVKANVADGETYWRVIGVHHLEPLENQSGRNIYLEALDEQGNPIRTPPHVYVDWTWVGRRPNENIRPVVLDKGINDPAGGDIGLHFGQVVSVSVLGVGPNARDKSDRVENLHTAHPDEPLPDGRLLNTLGHHSFYVVFQRTRKAVAVTGLITGRLERGQGQTVRLIRNGQVVAQQVVGADLGFRFPNLALGTYSLDVANTSVRQDNVQLTAANSSQHVGLAVPVPTQSVIAGRVTNGQNHTIQLLKDGAVLRQLPLPPSGDFRFDNLGAGAYSVVVSNTTARRDNLVLDGNNSVQVNLEVPVIVGPGPQPPAGKVIEHYLLLGPPNSRGRQLSLLLAKDFILEFSVTVGFRVDEAKQARRVTILGEGISQADIQAIRDAGSNVEVLSGSLLDVETQLLTRIQNRRPFG